MNSIIDNQIDKEWFQKLEFEKCLKSSLYFYENYIKIKDNQPNIIRDIDRDYFEMYDLKMLKYGLDSEGRWKKIN